MVPLFTQGKFYPAKWTILRLKCWRMGTECLEEGALGYLAVRVKFYPANRMPEGQNGKAPALPGYGTEGYKGSSYSYIKIKDHVS